MDTATRPWSVASGSYSSRFAPAGSSAVYTAAMRVRSKLLHLAAEQLQVPAAALRLQAGRVYHGDKDTGLSIRRLAGLTHWSPTELPSDVEPGVYAGRSCDCQRCSRCPRYRAYCLAPISNTGMGFALPGERWTAEKRGVT